MNVRTEHPRDTNGGSVEYFVYLNGLLLDLKIDRGEELCGFLERIALIMCRNTPRLVALCGSFFVFVYISKLVYLGTQGMDENAQGKFAR